MNIKFSALLKLFIIFIFSVFYCFLISCSESGTGPKSKPPGYQEDVPWPSLADSPWPMYHGDPQSTGRSKYVGPLQGTIEWEIDSLNVKSGVSIGNNDNIYFTSIGFLHGLFAANSGGDIHWKLEDVDINIRSVSTPLVAFDGSIYLGGGILNRLYAVNPDGTMKWEIETEGSVQTLGMNLGMDGVIYFITGLDNLGGGTPALNAVDIDGILLWRLENVGFNYTFTSRLGLSFSPDGKTLYIPGRGPSIFAIDIDTKIIKWTFGDIQISGSALVDTKGCLYFQTIVDSINSGKAALYSLNADGTIRWSYVHNNPIFSKRLMADGTMDQNGNYYFALDTLYSLDYNGNLRWKLGLDKESREPLTCDINGVVFVPLRVGNGMAAVSSEGNIIWQLDFPIDISIGQSPAIGRNQTMYVASYDDDFVYAIK